jgi:urease accessory protein
MINGPAVSTDLIADERSEALICALSLLQLTDSAFPIGRYTHSYGLEAYARCRLSDSLESSRLVALLTDTVRLGVGPSDGVALACAHRAVRADLTSDLQMVRGADRRLSAVKLASEARDASIRVGRTLLAHAQDVFRDVDLSDLAHLVEGGESPGNQAVITGVLSAKLGVGRLEAVAADLFGFSTSWVAAAVRLGLTDHRVGQRILRVALPAVGQAAWRATSGDVKDIWSCTPLLDVMSMRHEQAEVRLFAS